MATSLATKFIQTLETLVSSRNSFSIPPRPQSSGRVMDVMNNSYLRKIWVEKRYTRCMTALNHLRRIHTNAIKEAAGLSGACLHTMCKLLEDILSKMVAPAWGKGGESDPLQKQAIFFTVAKAAFGCPLCPSTPLRGHLWLHHRGQRRSSLTLTNNHLPQNHKPTPKTFMATRGFNIAKVVSLRFSKLQLCP